MTGRRTRSRAAVATAALVSCALLLTGCGIKRSGVIDSGHAATVKVPGAKSTIVYFLSKDGDRLVPTPVTGFEGHDINPEVLLLMLLEGPRGRAAEVGLTTGLPQPTALKDGSLAVSPYSHAGMTVRVPFAVAGLSELARMQIVCTIGISAVRDVISPITLMGTDTTLASADCSLKP
ncbi:GerMN domain-containing protein [Streptomyces sp. NPDC085540]|uniref:GerMN domain-containing protein n=1 Tax=Streptomyces sp. NPDC085540 TaxID=3365730 RepID=UPI0037D7F6C2